jgi:hypothetical protein
MSKLLMLGIVFCAFLLPTSSAQSLEDEAKFDITINATPGDNGSDSKSSDGSASDDDSKSSDDSASDDDSKSSDDSASDDDSKSSDDGYAEDDDLGVVLTEKDLGCGNRTFEIGFCKHAGKHSNMSMQRGLKYWKRMRPCIVKCVMHHGKHHGKKNTMKKAMRECQKACICGSGETHKYKYENHTHKKWQ